jgi:hypothetical protein
MSSNVIASSEAIHSFFTRLDGLLRFTGARIRATRWLAMTVSAV